MGNMTKEMREILEENIAYFATASKDSKPNVVPVGLVKVISDSEVLIVDVLFNKTRKNLKQNPQVALAVTDVRRLESYQFKGKAQVFTKGKLFDKAPEIMQEKAKRRQETLKKLEKPELKEKIQKINRLHEKLKPKAVALVNIEEIYSTMKGWR